MSRVKSFDLLDVVHVVAAVLEMPRDRLGRLEATDEPARAAREKLSVLALHYDIANGGRDYMDQCAKVLRAAAKAKGRKS